MGKKATNKRIKARLKELETSQRALLQLIVLADAGLDELKERHHSLKNAVKDHLDSIRQDQNSSSQQMLNLFHSLETTDEVLEDVVQFLRSLPKFQGGPNHSFRGIHNDNQEAQDRDNPHSLN